MTGNQEPQQVHYVWWLVPSSPLKEILQKRIINELAHTYDAVEFEPHITLAPSTPTRNDDVWRKSSKEHIVLNPISIDASRMRIETDRKFTQCVYLRFDDDITELNSLRQYVLEEQGSDSKEEDRFPHLSLIYKKVEETESRQLIAAKSVSLIDNLGSPLVFDRLQLMKIQLPVQTNDDVRKWKCVATYLLDGSNRVK